VTLDKPAAILYNEKNLDFARRMMGTEVYVAGVGMTKFGKSTASLPELMVEAASRAIGDARIHTID
jgi:hypothetical protein